VIINQIPIEFLSDFATLSNHVNVVIAPSPHSPHAHHRSQALEFKAMPLNSPNHVNAYTCNVNANLLYCSALGGVVVKYLSVEGWGQVLVSFYPKLKCSQL
jgi:hypothetical protein